MAFCGAEKFFAAVEKINVRVPALTMAADGQPCPTSRDFSIVDADPSDNVITGYLYDMATASMMVNTAANKKKYPDATELWNGSDERLLSSYVKKALNCPEFTAPDLGDDMRPRSALFLNEIFAARNQQAPVALIGWSNIMAFY